MSTRYPKFQAWLLAPHTVDITHIKGVSSEDLCGIVWATTLSCSPAITAAAGATNNCANYLPYQSILCLNSLSLAP